MTQERDVSVGDQIVYHNPVGVPHRALVTAVWTKSFVNVVIVSSDEGKTDVYGRQIERVTSLSHKSAMPVHGNYWRFDDEEPNP